MDMEQLKQKLEEVEMVNHSIGIISQTISDINDTCITDTVLEFSETHTKGLNKAIFQLYEFQSEKLDNLFSSIDKEEGEFRHIRESGGQVETDLELKERYVL
ncbi:hypothetical protein MLD55_01535 [Alcanivorax sp. MM125-6]|nr:hypothetical protein [Alcanivorax sp. MM125-6]